MKYVCTFDYGSYVKGNVYDDIPEDLKNRNLFVRVADKPVKEEETK